MRIYWVLFSSCRTTSRGASWILNGSGNSAHLLFLKVSTVWNVRIFCVGNHTSAHWVLRAFFSSSQPAQEQEACHLPPLVWLKWPCCLAASSFFRTRLVWVINGTDCRAQVGITVQMPPSKKTSRVDTQVAILPAPLPTCSYLYIDLIARERGGEKHLKTTIRSFCVFSLKFSSTIYHYSPSGYWMLHSGTESSTRETASLLTRNLPCQHRKWRWWRWWQWLIWEVLTRSWDLYPPCDSFF